MCSQGNCQNSRNDTPTFCLPEIISDALGSSPSSSNKPSPPKAMEKVTARLLRIWSAMDNVFQLTGTSCTQLRYIRQPRAGPGFQPRLENFPWCLYQAAAYLEAGRKTSQGSRILQVKKYWQRETTALSVFMAIPLRWGTNRLSWEKAKGRNPNSRHCGKASIHSAHMDGFSSQSGLGSQLRHLSVSNGIEKVSDGDTKRWQHHPSRI